MSGLRKNMLRLAPLILLVGGLWWFAGRSDPTQPDSPHPEGTRSAQFTGSQTCASCHQAEFDVWKGSDHELAMQPATEKSVLADFNNSQFVHYAVTSRFFRAEDKFMVETDGPDGRPTSYAISHVIGLRPLQQYMITFPDGRIQVLSICWDTRPESEGGQRWYHLYPDEAIPHDDELHWTGPNFNWNYMCADCHVTGYEKNYDLQADKYASTWHEGMVGCEACHGPGSDHVEWAQGHDSTTDSSYDGDNGLQVKLREAEVANWLMDETSGQPRRSHPLNSAIQVETCARCHAHRRPLQDHFIHGQSFHDTHQVSMLEDRLYHADGQIDEEVYVYGSFVQSRMYHKGVRCSDCHDPHSQKLHAPGNALCVRCHDVTKYDVESHHFHQAGTPGAQCVECHMPSKTFMGVDARRDHSLRIPRPDLAEALGGPDACTKCHADKDPAWATAELAKRFGPQEKSHYGSTFSAAHRRNADAWKDLLVIVQNVELPVIVRATALQLLRDYPRRESLNAMIAGLSDKDPLIRQRALAGLEMLPVDQRYASASHLLEDPVRLVRLEAARQMAGTPSVQVKDQEALESAIEEFKKAEMALADRPGAHMVLGLLYTDLQQYAEAEAAYRQAMKLDPAHFPSRVNLAELYYTMGRVGDGEPVLNEALRQNPSQGLIHESLGMLYIRQKRYDRAVSALQRAATLLPNRARTQYICGVALNDRGRADEAIVYLIKAHELEPANPDYLIGLTTVSRDAGQIQEAVKYARKLEALEPGNPEYRQLRQALESR